MKRDQVLGVIAAVVAAVAAFLPWITRAGTLYDAGGKTSLKPIDIPVSFLFSGAGTSTSSNDQLSLLAVVLGIAGGLLVWTFLPRTARRILYLLWGLLAVAVPVLIYVQLSGDIDEKGLDTSAFQYLAIGAYLCVGAGLVALVGGIIGAGKSRREQTPQPVAAYPGAPGYPQPGYGQPAYGEAAAYGAGAAGPQPQQPWQQPSPASGEWGQQQPWQQEPWQQPVQGAPGQGVQPTPQPGYQPEVAYGTPPAPPADTQQYPPQGQTWEQPAAPAPVWSPPAEPAEETSPTWPPPPPPHQ